VTRDRILQSAQLLFAQGTYGSTTVRAIAASAGVNPALVIHYFGSKRDLFVASLRLPLQLRDHVAEVLRSDPDGLGERLVRLYLGLWRQPSSRGPLAAMVRSVFSDQEAADALGQFLSEQMVGPIVVNLGSDRPQLRIALVASHLVGLVIGRHILGIAALVEADTELLVACVAPVIQRYLTGSLPAAD
jgi:AcrR family transcriptional regulator